MEQYNCVLGFLSLFTLLILIATNTLSKNYLETNRNTQERQNPLKQYSYHWKIYKVPSKSSKPVFITQQIWFIQYLSWIYCIPKLKYKRGIYRCCVVLLLLLLAVSFSVYVLLLYTRKINPWIIENLCACYICVNCCVVFNVSIAWENGNSLKCIMVSTSMNQSREKIRSLLEQSFKKGRGTSCADLRFSTHYYKSSEIILHLHHEDDDKRYVI